MENLPVEVLEIVFHPLSKKEDIKKCFNTNSKWRHIIENMFVNKSMYNLQIYFVSIFLMGAGGHTPIKTFKF